MRIYAGRTGITHAAASHSLRSSRPAIATHGPICAVVEDFKAPNTVQTRCTYYNHAFSYRRTFLALIDSQRSPTIADPTHRLVAASPPRPTRRASCSCNKPPRPRGESCTQRPDPTTRTPGPSPQRRCTSAPSSPQPTQLLRTRSTRRKRCTASRSPLHRGTRAACKPPSPPSASNLQLHTAPRRAA